MMTFVYSVLCILIIAVAYCILAAIAIAITNRFYKKMEASKRQRHKDNARQVFWGAFVLVVVVATIASPFCGKDVTTTVMPVLKPKIVSETSYNVMNVETLSQSGLFALTVEDGQGGTVEMKYMLPEYEKNEYGMLSPSANSVKDVVLSGTSDKLIVQKMSDGENVIILSGCPRSPLGNAINSYELYWKLKN